MNWKKIPYRSPEFVSGRQSLEHKWFQPRLSVCGDSSASQHPTGSREIFSGSKVVENVRFLTRKIFLSISLNIFQIFYIDFVKLFLCTFSVLRVKPKKSNIVFTFLWKCIAVICGERNILRLWSIYSKKKIEQKNIKLKSVCAEKKTREKVWKYQYNKVFFFSWWVTMRNSLITICYLAYDNEYLFIDLLLRDSTFPGFTNW